MDFYSKEHPSYIDENYKKLINKWLNKEYPIEMSIDNPNVKTTMAFKKVLDFYESSDLNEYIDSLRNVFYKKYNKNELGSLNCIK